MFSVARVDCATGYFSFGHEIGKNKMILIVSNVIIINLVLKI